MPSQTGDPAAGMVAVVPVRTGVLPIGALEAIAECGGRALVAGSDAAAAAGNCGADVVTVAELGPFQPARWASALGPLVSGTPVVVLPGSPDGRDLAPRLAYELDRPLFAGAMSVTPGTAVVPRAGGLEMHEFLLDEPVVLTLQPGVRGVLAEHARAAEILTIAVPTAAPIEEPEIVQVLPPDLRTMDLSEADRIVGGGAGLDSAARFEQLAAIAGRLGAAMGVTRVVTDRGWVDHERQIGTTGVVVDPSLYLAFGVSGAVQHTAGLGDPEHIISVNVDPHCPMMQLADVAIVTDANAVLDRLERLVGAGPAAGGSDA